VLGQLENLNIKGESTKSWKIVPMIVLLGLVVIVAGCVGQSSTSSNTGLRTSNAQYIGNFMALLTGDEIDARFSLQDGSKNYVSGDGIGSIRIVNSEGETVYTGTINVKKEDFKTYTLVLTGNEFLAYGWSIPLSTIKNATSSTGTAYFKFTTATGEFNELETSVFGLPTYTTEELNAISEQNFLSSSTTINKQLSNYGLDVTVTKAGRYEYVQFGSTTENLRIDLRVKNMLNKKQSFTPNYNSVIICENRQYKAEYGGTFDGSVIYPNIVVEGYVLFPIINCTDFNLIVEDTPSYDNQFSFSIDLSKNNTATIPQTSTMNTSCGSDGMQCCPSNWCESSYSSKLVCFNNLCKQCGEEGLPCCSVDECEYGTICSSGICRECGSSGQPCCENSKCYSGACTDGICKLASTISKEQLDYCINPNNYGTERLGIENFNVSYEWKSSLSQFIVDNISYIINNTGCVKLENLSIETNLVKDGQIVIEGENVGFTKSFWEHDLIEPLNIRPFESKSESFNHDNFYGYDFNPIEGKATKIDLYNTFMLVEKGAYEMVILVRKSDGTILVSAEKTLELT